MKYRPPLVGEQKHRPPLAAVTATSPLFAGCWSATGNGGRGFFAARTVRVDYVPGTATCRGAWAAAARRPRMDGVPPCRARASACATAASHAPEAPAVAGEADACTH